MATVKEMLEGMLADADKSLETRYDGKLVTSAELKKLVRCTLPGFKIVVSVRLDAPVGNGETFYRDAIATSVEISRGEAKWFADKALSETLEAKGARVRCYTTKRAHWKTGKENWTLHITQ